jgi:hypothetical protein
MAFSLGSPMRVSRTLEDNLGALVTRSHRLTQHRLRFNGDRSTLGTGFRWLVMSSDLRFSIEDALGIPDGREAEGFK